MCSGALKGCMIEKKERRIMFPFGGTKIKKIDSVNEGINLARSNKDAVLLDVRSKEEYRRGHIAGSINIPLEKIARIEHRVPNKEAPLYITGNEGAKPIKAARAARKMGYTHITTIGMMEDHHGLLVQ